MKKSTSELLEQLVFYVIIFLILREWLVPIMMLTDTGYFSLFMAFIALCLVIGWLNLPVFLSWPLKLAYITWFTVYVYDEGILTTRQFLAQELRYNSSVLMAGDWIAVSDAFRTSLFFLLIWMLIYLIQHWVTVRLTIYYFLVLTVLFIATLDTFTEYDGAMAIIKVMILGLVMTSVLFIKRLMQSVNMQKDWRSYFVFAAPIIVLVTVVGLVATFLPKAEPQWPDPVPYMKGWAGVGSSDTNMSTVGYGNNDESLGGPFIGDDTLVYQIQTPIRQYWRVETKDTYTSKGWIQSSSQTGEELFQSLDTLPLSVAAGTEEPQFVDVQALTDYPFLLQAYGTTSYQLYDQTSLLKFNANNEKISVLTNNKDTVQSNYSFLYQQPEYSFTELKESPSSAEKDPRYLQLPEELPQRVIDLAHELTAPYDSVYDQARAIEDYFKQGGYQYETQNVKVPAANEDYVDQFLFETKLGYCDNFSTSMVVLLRSVGIEARWVKGFSSGERIMSLNGVHTYEVTNNDAHSWVEVYIDGVGWVPFEPTLGFSNPVNIDYDVVSENDQAEQLPEPEEVQPEAPQEQPQDQEKSAGSAGTGFDFGKLKWLLYIVAAALVMIAIVLWRKRGKWQPKLVVQMNRSKLNNEETFEDGYFVLLKQLERIQLKRRQDETLKQFAKRVDEHLNTTKMSELTSVYEETIYAESSSDFNTLEMKESWEYLINRTSS